METRLTCPLTDTDARNLEIGDIVYLDGLIFTGRIRFYEHIITNNNPVPIDLRRACNVQFHCSPAVREESDGEYFVSAVTGTASFRFVRYLGPMFERFGLKAIIGKAGMASETYETLFRKHGAIYLSTMGYGFGALYGQGIAGVQDVFFKDEFGLAQAMWVLRTDNFGPLIVDGDTRGRSLQNEEKAAIRPAFHDIISQYRDPALKRSGETRDPTDDMIDSE